MAWTDAQIRRALAILIPLVVGLVAVSAAILSAESTLAALKLSMLIAIPVGVALGVIIVLLRRDAPELREVESPEKGSEAIRRAWNKAATHDMLEPLRKIRTFGAKLGEKYGDKLDAGGRLYLDRMVDGASRQYRLVEQMLDYSRIDGVEPRFEACRLGLAVESACERLNDEIREGGADIRVAELPTLVADPRLIERLMVELLSNAIKFRRADSPPIIEITHERVECEGEIREKIVVSDNGIGFDAQYAERIFGVLDRLHSRSEYDGTGVGLAIARRIAEIHHGSLTAEPRPEEGAAFILILPGQK